jgi:hypothetical protein
MTQSSVGWLRSSSFSRKSRLSFEVVFMFRGNFASMGFILGLCVPLGNLPGYAGIWQRNINSPRKQWNFSVLGETDFQEIESEPSKEVGRILSGMEL